MSKTIRLDATVTSTRPDLQVNANRIIGPGLPGSFIIIDGKHIPNMDDDAMRGRIEIRNKKSEISIEEKKEEKKTDAVDQNDSSKS